MSDYQTPPTDECVICYADTDAHFGANIVGVGFVCDDCYRKTEGRDIERVVNRGEGKA
jgi:recombinational DNA repair protein (RecF pathway)